jgi:hypothetical protein
MYWATGVNTVTATLLLLTLLAPMGCQNVYYGAWERLGVHKRDILRDRIGNGQEEQEEAREQFQSAYESFKEVAGYQGGKLEDVYGRLQAGYDESAEKAEAVRDRNKSVEEMAGDLFDEWRSEIRLIEKDSYRRQSQPSQQSLRDTKARSKKLIAAMKRAEARWALCSAPSLTRCCS